MSRTSDLEKENEELKIQIANLEGQIDSYRFGQEMKSWPPAVEVIREGLTGDIEKRKQELAQLEARIAEFKARIAVLSKDIVEKEYLAREVNSLRVEVHQLETKASRLRGDYDLTEVMQLIRQLFIGYELMFSGSGEVFRYKLGKSNDITFSDIEKLIRRAIRTV